MWALLVLLFFLVFIVSLVCLPFKSQRRKAKWTAAASLAASIFAFSMFAQGLEEEARRLGFKGAADQRAAKDSGVTDPVAWRAASEAKQQAAEAESARREADELAVKQAEETKCAADLQCLAEKKMIDASFKCVPLIERLAKNNFEWIDKWYEPKLSHFSWKDRKAQVVTYTGDKIKYQNGFGAWVSASMSAITMSPLASSLTFAHLRDGCRRTDRIQSLFWRRSAAWSSSG